MTRRRYTDKFRASAVVMLEAAGYAPGENNGALQRVSDHLKVPASTLSGWFSERRNAPPPELVLETREQLSDVIRAEVAAIFREMPKARGEADYRTLATAAGILVDKLQLLRGEPTDRHKIVVEYVAMDFNEVRSVQN